VWIDFAGSCGYLKATEVEKLKSDYHYCPVNGF
jgi:hypothetical protein